MPKPVKAEAILSAMRGGYEGESVDANGVKGSSVYLDNFRPKGMSVNSFRSYLKVLSEAGFYKSTTATLLGLGQPRNSNLSCRSEA